MKEDIRAFTICKVNGNNVGSGSRMGRFTVKNTQKEYEKKVAERMVSYLRNKKVINEGDEGTIIFKETTRNKNNRYSFQFRIEKLDTPRKHKFPGRKEYSTFNYRNIITNLKKIDLKECKDQKNQEGGGSKKKRIFTIVDFPEKGQTYGSYSGSNPRRAASKAFTRLAKFYNFKNSTNDYKYINFTIRETTKSSANKEYTYYGTRVKLFKPTVVNINGKSIKYNYKNIITNSRDVQ